MLFIEVNKIRPFYFQGIGLELSSLICPLLSSPVVYIHAILAFDPQHPAKEQGTHISLCGYGSLRLAAHCRALRAVPDLESYYSTMAIRGWR